jgi:amino acid adenylation domain-containing protein
MVPSAFVEMDELPLNASGKVDRSRLPEPETAVRTGQTGAPLTPVQELLAGIVAAVLRRDRIDVRESFLGLGGHSLMATQVVSRTREAFGVDLPLAALFEETSIAGLAERIETLLADGRTELPPLLPVSREGEIPLSWSQERLWILDQLEPGLAAYNIPLSARLTGDLDIEALRASLGEIVRRHEALRTRFTMRGGAPIQEIRPFESLALPVIDAGSEDEALDVARTEAARPFDLERDSLIRALLLRLSGTDHVLLVNLHHIVSDGWSTGVLLRELAALYPAFREGRPSPLSPLPIQYADFAAWQRGWLRGEALERELAFWRRTLEDVPELDLPTDRPRRSVTSFDGGLSTSRLGPDLAQAVAKLCQSAKVTPFMALLAAWEMLLARYAGQDDFAVGVPVANRDRIETEGLIGFFVNTIVIRTSPASTTLETLKRVRETALAAFAHRDMPFQKLVEELQPRRSQQLSPFFQVFFALQNAPMPPLELPGLTLSPFPMDTGTAKFELSLALMEDGEGWSVSLEHSRDLFDGDTADRLLRHYAALVGAMAGAPDAPARELPLLSDAERHQLLVTWNDTERPGSAGRLVHRLFEQVAAVAPESVALVRGDDRITYEELNRRANRLARRLRSLGVGPETTVGVFLDSSPELIVAYLAALKAGGAYLPLVPGYPKDRLELMLEETRTPVVLTRAELRGQLEGLPATVLDLDEEVREDDSNLPALVESGTGLAYVMYTSGSTGRPKGVAVNHEGIVRLVRDSGFADFGPDQVFLQITAISFDVSTFEIWGALLNGGKLAFLSSPGLTLEEIGEAIARHGVTTLWLSSGLFSVVADRRLEDLKPLRQLVVGGDVVPLPQARRVLDEIPGCRLIDGYGPTENTTFTACRTVTREDVERPSIPIGRPLNNTTAYVLDRDLQPVPVGVRGDLYTGGLGLARGYFGRPDLTAEVFVPHPFGRPGERLYNTGDIARWLPDSTGGILEFLGRRDTQVKVRGFRIEPGEIEAALAGHAAVAEAVVVAREDRPDRPGDRRLAAYLVPAPGAEPSAAELQEHLRRSLPDYMIPSVFVVLDALPLNRSGKVDRKALPAPGDTERGSQANYVPPRTDMEERIARVWREALGVERVGVHDSFFELGGHSLLLLQVVGRLQEALGRDLPKGMMFEHPTIASLAAALAPASPVSSAPTLERSQDRAAARRESLRQRQRPR